MNKWAMTAMLIAFMIFIGVRRFRGMRRLRPIRPVRFIVRVLIIGTVAGMMLLIPTVSLPVFLGGFTLGLMLGLYSLSLTSFEPGVKGAMFKPHPWIGNILVAMFIVRVGWRTVQRIFNDEPMWQRFGEEAADGMPWTMVLMFIFLGYAMTYTVGLIIRGRSIPRLPEPATELSGESVTS